MAEGRDWTRSQFERCPDCGADPSAIADEQLGRELLREVAAWGSALAKVESLYPKAATVRPESDVWSALEYACHVRDVLPVMERRIERMLIEDDPDLGWWDHEAAVVEDRYNEQVPVSVIEAMSANARSFSATLGGLRGTDWDRRAQRRAGEFFTVRGIARFVLHEVIHHREDAFHDPSANDRGTESPS
ncbi:MAG: DinB family protein [Actinomycetota bacterium]